MYKQFVFIYFLASEGVTSNTVTMTNWTRDKAFDNFISQSGLERAIDVGRRGIYECLTNCNQEFYCLSAFYISNVAKCILEDHVNNHLEELTELQGSKYYKQTYTDITLAPATPRTTTIPLTITPPITVPVFVCPVWSEGWNNVQLSDGTSVISRFIKQDTTQTDAKYSCMASGGHLLTILTEARFQYFNQLLMSCPEISEWPPGKPVWIDGSNSQAVDKTAVNAYTTSTGGIMFTNSGFWAPGKPIYPKLDHCVVLDNMIGYYMTDYHCTSALAWYFCEK